MAAPADSWIVAIFAGGIERSLAPGAPLFLAGDPVRSMALVLEGRVDLVRATAAGGEVVLQRATAGQVVSEAAAYSETYHCDARTGARARLRLVSRDVFRARLRADPDVAELWAAQLARSVQAARLRAEVRSLRTVGARLDAWLGARGALPEKGGWHDLAAELGVTPEALYRELARRRGRV